MSGRRAVAGRALVATLFVVATYGPYLWRLEAYGPAHADRFLAWQLAVNDALRHGELLHWNPYTCGGTPGLASPESGALSPLNVLGLVLDPIVQQKVELLLHLVACAVGFDRLARRLGLSPWLGVLGFFVGAGNGFMALCVLHGQSSFFPLLLLPLLIELTWPASADRLADERGLGSPGRALAAVALVSLALLEDGFQVLISGALVPLGVALATAIARRSAAPLGPPLLVLGAPLLVCAARTFPLAILLHRHPPAPDDGDFLTPRMAMDALFSSRQLLLYERFRPLPPHHSWATYGAFLGAGPALLAALALPTRRTPAVLGLAGAAALGLILFLGRFSATAPWALLSHATVARLLDSPTRFAGPAIVALAVLVMIGADAFLRFVRDRARPGIRRFVWAALLFVIGVDLAGVTGPLVTAHANAWVDAGHTVDTRIPFEMTGLPPGIHYFAALHNKASTMCNELLPLPNAARADLRAAFLLGGGKAFLEVRPNELEAIIDAPAATTLVVNENFSHDFSVTGDVTGTPHAVDGLLAVDVAAGNHRVKFRYDPGEFHVGIAMSAVSLVALALWYGRARRRWPPPVDRAAQRFDRIEK